MSVRLRFRHISGDSGVGPFRIEWYNESTREHKEIDLAASMAGRDAFAAVKNAWEKAGPVAQANPEAWPVMDVWQEESGRVARVEVLAAPGMGAALSGPLGEGWSCFDAAENSAPLYKVSAGMLQLADGTGVRFAESPNRGGQFKPKYLVIHYTAGASAGGAIAWLTNPEAKASAHLVIGRDGGVTQLVPFDKMAWHAGSSSWGSLTGLNKYSIGIELDNAGRMNKVGAAWQSSFGQFYAENEVVVAQHKHEDQVAGWHAYTEPQLSSLVKVAATLHAQYAFTDILGHEDIAPKRKTDPGPAFPMSSFKAKILGRSE